MRWCFRASRRIYSPDIADIKTMIQLDDCVSFVHLFFNKSFLDRDLFGVSLPSWCLSRTSNSTCPKQTIIIFPQAESHLHTHLLTSQLLWIQSPLCCSWSSGVMIDSFLSLTLQWDSTSTNTLLSSLFLFPSQLPQFQIHHLLIDRSFLTLLPGSIFLSFHHLILPHIYNSCYPWKTLLCLHIAKRQLSA